MKHFVMVAAAALFLSACEDGGSADSKNRIVQIGNTTGVTMTHFFASNTTRDT